MPTPVRRPPASLLASLAGLVLCGCAAYQASRVVTLSDVPDAVSVRQADADGPAPLFVDTTAAIVAKRQLATAIAVEPSLETFVERALEEQLGADLERVRVDYVGYRYAYYFPSRKDDFVLRVEIDAPAAGIRGEFEGVVRGDEVGDQAWLLGPDWHEHIPDSGAGLGRDDPTRALERRADHRAWLHRALIREATRRLALAVAPR